MQLLLRKYISQVITEAIQPTKEQITAALELLTKIVKSSDKYRSHVFLVGGAVRDQVMGKEPKDLDIVIDLPKGGIEFAEYLAKYLNIFKQGSNPVVFPNFGTAKIDLRGVVYNNIDLTGVDIEAVVTRTEIYEPGSRKPQVGFGTINQDVMRRDLTINSLVKDLTTGKILDLTGKGLKDIRSGIIRTTSTPEVILTEDPLRILRAIRFASKYKYKIDNVLESIIKKKANELTNISFERIRDEFEKMLVNKNAAYALELLFNNNLMQYIIPELSQKKKDTITIAEKQKGNFDFIEMLTLIMHNLDVNIIKSNLKKLKLSNEEIKRITALANAIQVLKANSAKNVALKVGAFLNKNNVLKHIEVLYVIDSSLRNIIKSLKDFGKQPTIFFDGNELMQLFNLRPGVEIGKLISLQRELWFNDPNITKDKVIKFIKSQQRANNR
ncbi:hypothetical protein CMI47_12850 [Candidatus Pacearchaeota archaeon]|nr:hypothetical protein [Candidatus Pacearchaeota archaeon]|tara:strand:+ start:45884 stop:47206 length:1323 start_codon:yes stop_codon:yes gene_type:complete